MLEQSEVILPDGCKFGIRASSIASFFRLPAVWYSDNCLKKPKEYTNTGIELGKIIHYCISCHIKKTPIHNMKIEQHINQLKNVENVEHDLLHSLWEPMLHVFITNYLPYQNITSSEQSLSYSLGDEIALTGTYDAMQGNTIIDFKVVSRKPSNLWAWEYEVQLLAYAYLANKNGLPVDSIQLVYLIRPTKTLKSRLEIATKQITQEDLQELEKTILLIKESVVLAKKNPEIVHLLFKSWTLQNKPPIF